MFILHGHTRKIPLEEEEIRCYDYKEDYIIQKLLYHSELAKHIANEGYTQEQTKNIIHECKERGIIDKTVTGPDHPYPKNTPEDLYLMTNEEHWVEKEHEHLGYIVIEEIMKSEVKDYVLEYQFDWEDKDEEKLREIYAEQNEKELSKEQLINGLMRKGYTEKEAEKLIEKYTTIETPEEEKKNWKQADKLFKRPQYKPLLYHKNYRILRERMEKRAHLI